jgi:peroxiredoxin
MCGHDRLSNIFNVSLSKNKQFPTNYGLINQQS